MSLAMPVVWSDDCRLHDPGNEIWVGVATPASETPTRIDAIRAALADATFVDAEPHDDLALMAVHDARLVDYLATAWDDWQAAGLPDDPGSGRVVPYIFAHALLAPGLEPVVPSAVWARPGYFTYDTMTLVGPGTWEAARAAVDAALTAADLVLGGAPHAYACCRPPGHHACRSVFGGSCYLNNAAAAAHALSAGGRRVAVLDIDAHHGNGTQDIFRNRTDVFTASVHVDPATGWFPHFVGFARESGDANLNLPVPPGAGDETWLYAIRHAAAWTRANGAEALVVALGVDAAARDPESPLEVSAAGLREAGRIVGDLGLPTVLVQEGGYDVAAIGSLVLEVLQGVEQGL